MRTIPAVLAAILAFFAGILPYPHSMINGLLSAAVAFLLMEVLTLRGRIGRLEQRIPQPSGDAERDAQQAQASAAWNAEAAEAGRNEPPLRPVPPMVPPAAPVQSFQPEPSLQATTVPAPPDRQSHPPHNPGSLTRLAAPLIGFFTSGNPILKIGVVVLFFGVAFLLKYAAQRNLIPIELRLLGVVCGGVALLVAGWKLRRKHLVYGLGLEGGGIGILYLAVYAAAKLYHLLPMPLALALMIGLVGLSCALAVLQDAKGLAISGTIGGFLAPVLMSTGGGSHVTLFSYYALLNSGILGIAWFKSWRELNLVGFLFTFSIVAMWGVSAYSPQHFATAEPFLILFFLMYCLISVLFALRQPLQLRGFIDGPLVFGLPIVASGLQACLVRDFHYGMGFSALALGFWYIGLARLLWNRKANEMRLLTEAFLALGVVFASLAIPLSLDPQWTTAAWALEGAAMVWVGVRQNRPAARVFGLLLQAGAAVPFLRPMHLPPESLLFANRAFLGSALIGVGALFSSFWLDRNQDRARPWETALPQTLLAWGLIWWHGGGYRDLERRLEWQTLPPAFLLYACATAICLGLLVHRFAWRRLAIALLILLPIMCITLASQTVGWNGGPVLIGFGWLAWPLAFAIHFALLARFETQLPQQALPLWHSLGFWLLLLTVTVEIAWRVGQIAGITEAWSLACWGLTPTALLFALEFRGDRLQWPVARFAATYHGVATDLPLLALLLWCFVSFAVAGDPAPLPYIPILNPLELIELAILLLAAIRVVRRPSTGPAKSGRLILTAALLFAWMNVVVGRSVHFFTGAAYSIDRLFASTIFQAAIAALWSVLALALTIRGARKQQRTIWLVGAGLLALVVAKLFLIDLSGTGAIGRIVSFLVVGLLMLVIGFFAPLPPQSEEPAP